MLHPILSNGICSLNQDEDKLTKTVIMDIDNNGNIVDYDICKSVIRSRKKMDYASVYLTDGCLNVNGSHHDGSNGYYIYPLSKEGCDIIYSWEQGYDDDYFEDMKEDDFFKKFVNDKKLIMKFNEKEFQL